jgi:hypothetical protein
MRGSDDRKTYSFEIFLVLLTASLAGLVSWVATQAQLNADHNNRLLEARLACFDRFVRDIEQFRSASFIYFFDLTAQIEGQQGDDSESKHLAFHDKDGDIRACAATAGVLFSEPVKVKARALVYYLQTTQWEVIVQSQAFRSKFLSEHESDATFDATKFISREVRYDDYLQLTNALVEAMADELKHNT